MRGEACVVHLLESFTPEELQEADLRGHSMMVLGTAVNQDGRSSSLTVCLSYQFHSRVRANRTRPAVPESSPIPLVGI